MIIFLLQHRVMRYCNVEIYINPREASALSVSLYRALPEPLCVRRTDSKVLTLLFFYICLFREREGFD